MYEIYKPLRNRLRRYDVSSGLLAIYHFIQHLQFDQPLPKRFSHHELRWKTAWQLGLLEWEFETLAREILINCPARAERIFESWSDISEVANHVKRIENDTWSLSSDIDNAILHELLRMAHRQFPWQQKVTRATIVRHLKIYRDSKLADIVRQEFDMTPDELFEIGLALSGHFLSADKIVTPVKNTLNEVDQDTINKFILRFSLTLQEHRQAAKESQSFDINWAYNINPLRLHPLVRVSEVEIICPMPPLLLRRLTDGLYFDLVTHRVEFDRAFGPAFQNYVGEVLTAANQSGAFTILTEERYGTRKQPKDSVDWIASDASASLFIECKASRMKLRGKIDLTSREAIVREIDRLADFVIQTYVTLGDAMLGLYSSWKPSGNSVYPIIVTMDDWQAFGTPVRDGIKSRLDAAIEAGRLSKEIVGAHPYTICAISDLEAAIQVMGHSGIEPFMRRKTDDEHALWAVHSFMQAHFKDGVRKHVVDLFADDYNSIGSRRRRTASTGA